MSATGSASGPRSLRAQELIEDGFRLVGQGIEDELLVLADIDGAQDIYTLH